MCTGENKTRSRSLRVEPVTLGCLHGNCDLMRFLLAVLFLALMFPTIGLSQTQTREVISPVDTVKAFLNALANADLDGIVAFFAEDATVFLPIPSVPKRLSGRKEIREGFAPFLENIRSSGHGPPYMVLNPQDMKVQEFGTTGIVTFHLGKLPGGESEEATSLSRRSMVLRVINGRWLIIHMHASNLLVQPKSKD